MKNGKNYQLALVAAREAATRMLDAEMDLGRAAAKIPVDDLDDFARDLGVRQSVVFAALRRAAGLVRRHRSLERATGVY